MFDLDARKAAALERIATALEVIALATVQGTLQGAIDVATKAFAEKRKGNDKGVSP